MVFGGIIGPGYGRFVTRKCLGEAAFWTPLYLPYCMIGLKFFALRVGVTLLSFLYFAANSFVWLFFRLVFLRFSVFRACWITESEGFSVIVSVWL